MTIVEFLLARIAEDEGELKSARIGDMPEWWAPAQWSYARSLAECAAKRRIVELHKFGPGYRQRQPWEPEWPQPEYVRDVCGECYEWDEDDDCASNAAAPCATIRTMAQVYNEHPDYRQDWA